MDRPYRKRARSSALLLAAAGVIAMLAFPGLAAAKQRDRNHDGIPDRWEKRHHLSLKVQQTHRDQDHDQLANQAEFQATDNPRDPDSDNDGVEDGDENAGTIQSFDSATGRLVINLFNGDTVAGAVTEQTEIECEDESEHAGTASVSDDGGEEANDEAAGEDANDANEAGDDNGSSENPDANDEGDDNAATSCTTADLVAGAVVEEAELSLEGGAATFKEIELAG